mmetsp:Transcript_21642/g.55723  ORF Transcript_21642/g.55723 Transcript_21642/m.55723 type:complete len:244 (-) Transcript_21642:149-880(-)
MCGRVSSHLWRRTFGDTSSRPSGTLCDHREWRSSCERRWRSSPRAGPLTHPMMATAMTLPPRPSSTSCGARRISWSRALLGSLASSTACAPNGPSSTSSSRRRSALRALLSNLLAQRMRRFWLSSARYVRRQLRPPRHARARRTRPRRSCLSVTSSLARSRARATRPPPRSAPLPTRALLLSAPSRPSPRARRRHQSSRRRRRRSRATRRRVRARRSSSTRCARRIGPSSTSSARSSPRQAPS